MKNYYYTREGERHRIEKPILIIIIMVCMGLLFLFSLPLALVLWLFGFEGFFRKNRSTSEWEWIMDKDSFKQKRRS
jgi:hypothetical protein